MSYGKFISIEGVDGAGKSTHLSFILDYLKAHHVAKNIVSCREPGGTAVGEAIRKLWLDADKMDDITELLLIFAARQQIISEVIVPAIHQGDWVVSDRFVEASFAYQGAGRQLGVERVKTLYSLLHNPLKTDLTIIFDVPFAVARERLAKVRSKDRIEQESDEFFLRVQEAYHQLAKDEPNRIKMVSTEGSIEDTQAQLVTILDNFLRG